MPTVGQRVRGDILGKRSNDYYEWMACIKCGRERWVLWWKRNLLNYTGLCLQCNAVRFTGSETRTTGTGYVVVLNHQHPCANSRGYVKRARLVLEKKIGRPLLPKCVIHHINGNKEDDRPSNLMEMTNSQHHALHMAQTQLIKKIRNQSRKEVVEWINEEIFDNTRGYIIEDFKIDAGILHKKWHKQVKEWGID